MSVQSEINRIQTNITNSLNAVAAKGVSVLATDTSNELPDLIASIPTDSGDNVKYTPQTLTTAQLLQAKTNIGLENVDNTADADKNVASATKLSTQVSLWGNSFDGTEDLKSSIVLQNGSLIKCEDTSGTAHMALGLTSANVLTIGYDTAGAGYTTNLYGTGIYFRYGTGRTTGMYLNSIGYVGIGTTSPSYKLDVSGSVRLSGTLRIGTTTLTESELTSIKSIVNSALAFTSGTDAPLDSQGNDGDIYLQL